MKNLKRHRTTYKILRIIIMPFIKIRFGFRFQLAYSIDQPTIILSNHNTDWDPILLAMSFKDHMYFVASEHIFRWGLISKIIRYLVSPISRAKATNDTKTVVQILRSIRGGANICIFAEGNKSFNGETSEIPASIGKLVRQSGANLITYKLTGGYFTQPRWGKTLRRGMISGQVVNTYTSLQLSAMSQEEVLKLIQHDLYVNAYEDQEQHQIVYKGKKLAEHLETALYVCPNCYRISSLISADDKIICNCGLRMRYSPYGNLISENNDKPYFKTILEWDRWQNSYLKELLLNKIVAAEHPITFDERQTLLRINKGESAIRLGEGRLSMYNDRMVFQSENKYSFAFDNIVDMAVHGRMNLVFSIKNGDYFEIGSQIPRSGIKYVRIFKTLTEKE